MIFPRPTKEPPVRDRVLTILAVVFLILGTGLLVPFTSPVTLALGVVCLVGFLVSAAILLLSPSRLE